MQATGVWWPRRVARGVFEIVQPDGRVYGEFRVAEWEWLPSSMARQVVASIAAHFGEPFGDAADPEVDPIDWGKLGWASEKDHDEVFADVRRVRDEAARMYGPEVVDYVTREAAAAELPQHGPFSDVELDALDRIVNRAIAVVAQDVDAEWVAA